VHRSVELAWLRRARGGGAPHATATHLHALGDVSFLDLPPVAAQLLAVTWQTGLAGDGDPPGLLHGKPLIWSSSELDTFRKGAPLC
jgi:hypothetical protein